MLHLTNFARTAQRVVDGLVKAIRPDELRSALQRLIGRTEILFVHSSLSSCGRFTAGPYDVLQAMREISGTLCMPTHTYCYPSAADEAGPLFDAVITPSKTGVLTEMFRAQPLVRRSINATHSMAATGTLAEALTDGHYLSDTPCGTGTPYRRLVQLRASVLLFGVTFHCYTLFHTAEDASGSEYAYERGTLDRLRVVDELGEHRVCWTRRQSRAPRRFEQAGGLLEHVGLVHRITLGRSHLLFVPDCSLAHDFLVERLEKVPDLLHLTCTKSLE